MANSVGLVKGRTAIVTGGASPRGLGKAIAHTLAAHGARVAVVDLDQGAAERAAADIGEGHLGVACDVTDAARCRAAVDEIAAALGSVDILVNNAGITQPLRTMEITPRDYDAVLDVNLRGTLNMSQATIPLMRRGSGGAIICISSASGQRGGGIFGGPHYSASKAGVLGLAKAMARELGPDGIRVNAIAPSLIDTDITAGVMTAETRDEIVAGIPLGRVGRADDVAGVCLFLASDLAAYVTGATIDVNGGSHIH
jgi:NAD(P)-dependent dehydrogenase (short-subunit alcohol dehydrogenase family)